MNKVLRARPTNGHPTPTLTTNGHSRSSPATNGSMARRQARELSSLLLGLTRELLVVEDATVDLPLRQLRVCALLFDGPRSMSSLSRELNVSLSATTQLADRL